MTKPLQGELFKKFKRQIMGHGDPEDEGEWHVVEKKKKKKKKKKKDSSSE